MRLMRLLKKILQIGVGTGTEQRDGTQSWWKKCCIITSMRCS